MAILELDRPSRTEFSRDASRIRWARLVAVTISSFLLLTKPYSLPSNLRLWTYSSTTQGSHEAYPPQQRRLSVDYQPLQPEQYFNQHHEPERILYIITSMAEFDMGRRATVAGNDRFGKTLVPVVRESTRSMLQAGYTVDVYLITHYPVTAPRRAQLRAVLPQQVGLQIWDEATPMGYAWEHSNHTIMPITRALARQHRYVIKDKFRYYDIFVNFEDDMLIRGPSVQHFLDVTRELYRIRTSTAPLTLPGLTAEAALRRFYGPLTPQHLSRMLPGFIRVEVARPGFVPPARNRFPQIPLDYEWNSSSSSSSLSASQRSLPEGQKAVQKAQLDPSICCRWPDDDYSKGVSDDEEDQRPIKNPRQEDLYFWETSIDALGVRKLPDDAAWDWVLMQTGNTDELYREADYVIGEYWSGWAGYFGNQARPVRTKSRYLNNQGGWMATRRQMIEWHLRWCRGGFLPPYEAPVYPYDGLDARTVEYWSGGIQIAGVKACNLQRIVTLDPAGFSKQLLYHTSNNKQRQTYVRDIFSGHDISEFWAQLNTVRKDAEAKRNREEAWRAAHPGS